MNWEWAGGQNLKKGSISDSFLKWRTKQGVGMSGNFD